MASATWRTPRYSGNSGGACVEAGVARPGRMLVRDTRDRAGAMLSVPADAGRRFTSALK